MDFSSRLQNVGHRYLQTLLVLGIVVVINFLSVQHFWRLDLSEENRFSLSGATERTLSELKDLVTIKVFFSAELPTHLQILSRSVRDFLDEYKAYGGVNLQVMFVDPMKDQKALEEVQSLGIPQLTMNVAEKDSIQVKQGFLGIGIFYGDKHEVVPVVSNILNLEYLLTSAIKKLTADEVKIVGFLSGHGEHSILELPPHVPQDNAGDYVSVKKNLESNYQVAGVEIKDGKLNQQVDTLVVAGPKEKIEEYEVLAIDQYLLAGGNVVMLIDRSQLTGAGLDATTVDSGLEEFLSHLGLSVEQNVVLDRSNEQAQFNQQFVQWVVDYPFWPKFLPATFSKENPIVSLLDSVVLPWSSSLTVKDEKNQQIEVLIRSQESSWTQTPPFNFAPNLGPSLPAADLSSQTMAVFISGEFDSFFKDRAVPAPLSEEAANGAVVPESSEILKTSALPGKVVLVGDSDFATDNFVGQFPQNLTFFLNIIDFLTLDPDLITIRSKTVIDRPIEELSESAKMLSKIGVILGMPVLIGAFGVYRRYARGKLKKRLT